MRSWISTLACLLLLTQAAVLPAQSTAVDSPVGLWKTIDEKTGAARALVRISVANGTYGGRIERSFRPGAETRVCSACTDDRKGRSIIGLEIIRGMTSRDGQYGGGEILDPESGTVYRCKFHLEDGGRKLVVRGYIGIALLGRSQTWLREP